jgi:uncharacterized UBP type Zn finger protein
MPRQCTHLDHAAARKSGIQPSGHGCAECLASGGVWVHLRLCLTCGHVGCCDNSPNKHATKHARRMPDHPVIRSYEPGEEWGYCYPDDEFVESLPEFPSEIARRHYDPPGE